MSRPLARPIASRHAREYRWTPRPFDGLTATNHSAAPRSSRVSALLLNQIERGLDEFDREVLNFVSECRLATGKHLVRRFWSGGKGSPETQARAGRRALKRLSEWRVLDPLPRSIGGIRGGSDSLIYGIGVAGNRLLVRRGFHAKRVVRPGERYIRHTLAITELVVRLHEFHREGELEVIEIQNEPACWRGFVGPMGARLVLKPDLFVRIGVGAFEDRWFLEVDLATEASSTVLSKAKRYVSHYWTGREQAEHGVYPRVLWAVPDDRRAAQVSAALLRLPREVHKLFGIATADEVPGRLAAEARR